MHGKAVGKLSNKLDKYMTFFLHEHSIVDLMPGIHEVWSICRTRRVTPHDGKSCSRPVSSETSEASFIVH